METKRDLGGSAMLKDKISLTIRDRVSQQTAIYPSYVPDSPKDNGVRDSLRTPAVSDYKLF